MKIIGYAFAILLPLLAMSGCFYERVVLQVPSTASWSR